MTGDQNARDKTCKKGISVRFQTNEKQSKLAHMIYEKQCLKTG